MMVTVLVTLAYVYVRDGECLSPSFAIARCRYYVISPASLTKSHCTVRMCIQDANEIFYLNCCCLLFRSCETRCSRYVDW